MEDQQTMTGVRRAANEEGQQQCWHVSKRDLKLQRPRVAAAVQTTRDCNVTLTHDLTE